MTFQRIRCTRYLKILRPERCVVLDGKSCPACTEDIELEEEVKELEDQIEKIHAKRRALRTVMNDNHDQLIAKFPPEIVSQIFIHYAPPDKTHASTPLYLGAVSQKWRQLAWRTPQLWTSLVVRFKPYYYPTRLLAEYLERSANLPLTISLFSGSQIIEDEIYLPVIEVLNRHSSRWHVLDVALPSRYLHRLCGSLGGNILQDLDIRPESTESRDIYIAKSFSMKSKPSPMHLTLARYYLANVDIFWNRLTTATLEYIAVDQCLELMRRAPLLEILSLIEVRDFSNVFPIPMARITLPQLLSLKICCTMHIELILDSMCAPSLKHWEHGVWAHISSPSPSSMVSFIGQSSFSLKSLTVKGTLEFYNQLHTILYHLSSLEFLTLKFRFRIQTSTDNLFVRLSDQASLFLPHLRTLHFSFLFMFPWESLPRLFSSPIRRSMRMKVDQLISVRIMNETVEKLVKLVDEGFHLTILSKGKVDVLEEYRKERRLSQTTHQ